MADRPTSNPGSPGKTTTRTPSLTQPIIQVLRDYEAAYSTHNLDQLGSLLTQGVTRHGLRAGGCSNTQGKQQVLQTYAEQFGGGTETYTFADLSPDRIVLTGARAVANLAYNISTTSGLSTGSVRFNLIQLTGHWLIQRIIASC